MKKLLMIASLHTDLFAKADALPRGNEDFVMPECTRRIDGCGCSMARFFEKIGFPYDLICDPGTGVYGEYARQTAAQEGIRLIEGSTETGGCTFRMEDQSGSQRVFLVEGSEFHFRSEQLYDLDAGEYAAVAVSSEMLVSSEADELIEALRELELPLFFIAGRRILEVSEDVLDDFFALNPRLIISDRDAYDLLGASKETADEAASALFRMCEAPVCILMSDAGAYFTDGNERWIAKGQHKADTDIWAAARIAAWLSGVDEKNGMVFANEYGYARMDDAAAESARKRLAGMILHR